MLNEDTLQNGILLNQLFYEAGYLEGRLRTFGAALTIAATIVVVTVARYERKLRKLEKEKEKASKKSKD